MHTAKKSMSKNTCTDSLVMHCMRHIACCTEAIASLRVLHHKGVSTGILTAARLVTLLQKKLSCEYAPVCLDCRYYCYRPTLLQRACCLETGAL